MKTKQQELTETLRREGVRALWWKQPYAALMLHGKIETRTWATNYRGWVLICASQKEYTVKEIITISTEEQNERILDVLGYEYVIAKTGVVIAIGRLVDCRPMTLKDSNKCFVEYISPWISINEKTGKAKEKQLWCHVYEDVQAVEPFPLKGCQGWLKLSEHIINKIKIINHGTSKI